MSTAQPVLSESEADQSSGQAGKIRLDWSKLEATNGILGAALLTATGNQILGHYSRIDAVDEDHFLIVAAAVSDLLRHSPVTTLPLEVGEPAPGAQPIEIMISCGGFTHVIGSGTANQPIAILAFNHRTCSPGYGLLLLRDLLARHAGSKAVIGKPGPSQRNTRKEYENE